MQFTLFAILTFTTTILATPAKVASYHPPLESDGSVYSVTDNQCVQGRADKGLSADTVLDLGKCVAFLPGTDNVRVFRKTGSHNKFIFYTDAGCNAIATTVTPDGDKPAGCVHPSAFGGKEAWKAVKVVDK